MMNIRIYNEKIFKNYCLKAIVFLSIKDFEYEGSKD